MLKSSRSLKAVYFLTLGAFVFLILSDYKRFVVWDQIVDHFKNDLGGISEEYLCKTKMEITLRTTNRLLKIDRITDEMLAHKCNEKEIKRLDDLEANEKSLVEVDNSFRLANLSHWVRFKIMSPLIVAATLTSVNIHTLFTILCVVGIFLISILLSSKEFTLHKGKFYLLATAIMGVSLSMNGRNLVSFFSLSLLVYAMSFKSTIAAKNRIVFLSTVALAMLFSNVSSGINLYILVFFAIWIYLNREILDGFSFKHFLLLTLIILVQSFWVAAGMLKNFSFYGGNILLSPFFMLKHGIGKYLFAPQALILIFILSVFYYKFRNQIQVKKKRVSFFQRTYLLGASLCLAAGLFGYSILSLTIIFSLLLATDLLFLDIANNDVKV
jgi:hypothetical protein